MAQRLDDFLALPRDRKAGSIQANQEVGMPMKPFRNKVGNVLNQLFSTSAPLAARPRRGPLLISISVLAVISSTLLAVGYQSPKTGVATILVFVALLRTYSLFRAVGWIWQRGDSFVEEYEKLGKKPGGIAKRKRIEADDKDDSDLLDFYRNVGGAFFPFGVRAIVLSEKRRKTNGLMGVFYKIYYLCWKFYFFTPLWALAVNAVVIVGNSDNAVTNALMLGGSITILFGCLSISLEAGLSYLIFRSWSLAYHRFDIRPRRSVTEFAAFAGGVVALIFSSQAAMTVADVAYSGYDKIDSRLTGLPTVGLTAYYSITTLSSNGDAGPKNFAGFAVTGIQYIASVAFLVIVISLLFDAIGKDPVTPYGQGNSTE